MPSHDEEPGDERRDVTRDTLGDDYEPRTDDDHGSRPLYRLADAALDGDQVAWCAWAEVCRAMKGKPVVRASRMLDRVWKDHEATVEAPEPEVLEQEPVVLVSSSLWESARRQGVAEMGLALGSTHGVEALAQWWHERLGLIIRLEESMPPRLSSRDGPAARLSPSLN